MQTILMIEDNMDIMKINRIALEKNYRIVEAYDLKSGRELYKKENPDLVILDIMLPDGSGLEFCEELKQIGNIPILLITALDESANIIEGLRRGGDDYITKPYDIGVLCARVEALLRRYKNQDSEHIIKIANLELNRTTRVAKLDGEDLLLAPRELTLFELLWDNRDRYISTKELYLQLWDTKVCDTGTVRLHIHKIRKKLGENSPVIINSEKGKGYILLKK